MTDASVDVLTVIHAVPVPDDLPVPRPEAGETALAAHLRRLREFYDWAARGTVGLPCWTGRSTGPKLTCPRTPTRC
ncbi:hypothetical protein MTP03_23440 [Tsukamurella sp. PLM1]|nr:hypothetical protein MTP03_23440 [Tsukamurella sp. PLM1]